ncbi:PREDICTED: sugar transporter SWEET1-like [Diuraphis noxia]|uniref:sugar transporter SWEET1-like n=1 Tax=Diuraphis noxia TaxID=143948 RepID=UPI000763AA8B|nr:PREDICTED: sugar transporter SWEET1-like [Diuraphis noxia]
MMYGYDFEYALRVSASASTCVQFLSGFLICTNFMKKGKVLNESVVPFVTGFLSCSLWLYYGMILANSTLVSVNTFGCLLFLIYTWIYYRYTSKKKRVIQYVISAIAIIAWIVYITYTNVNRKQSKTVLSAELYQHQTVDVAAVTPLDISDTSIISTTTNDAVDRVGLLCSLTTMLFFAAPFSNLIHVIRTKNTESMPLPLIVMTFLVSAQWLVYGRMLRDKFIMYPNAIGCMLSVIQLALFVIYPRRSAAPLTSELHNHHHPYPYIKLMDA